MSILFVPNQLFDPRFGRDPAVAKRVRILHVYPAFLQDAAGLNVELPVRQRVNPKSPSRSGASDQPTVNPSPPSSTGTGSPSSSSTTLQHHPHRRTLRLRLAEFTGLFHQHHQQHHHSQSEQTTSSKPLSKSKQQDLFSLEAGYGVMGVGMGMGIRIAPAGSSSSLTLVPTPQRAATLSPTSSPSTSCTSLPLQSNGPLSQSELLQLMVEVLGDLPNVVEYYITWPTPSPTSMPNQAPPVFTSPFAPLSSHPASSNMNVKSAPSSNDPFAPLYSSLAPPPISAPLPGPTQRSHSLSFSAPQPFSYTPSTSQSGSMSPIPFLTSVFQRPSLRKLYLELSMENVGRLLDPGVFCDDGGQDNTCGRRRCRCPGKEQGVKGEDKARDLREVHLVLRGGAPVGGLRKGSMATNWNTSAGYLSMSAPTQSHGPGINHPFNSRASQAVLPGFSYLHCDTPPNPIVTHLAPALSHLTSLRILTLQTRDPTADMGSFLGSVEHLVNLEELMLFLPLEPAMTGWGDPDCCLGRFLALHGDGLRVLRLRAVDLLAGTGSVSMTDGLGRRASLSPYAYSSSSPSSFPYIMGAGAGTPLDTYMRTALSVPNISFQRLETLDISSPLWPVDTALWVLARCAELSGGALKEVGMTGRERNMEDVSALAKVLSGKQPLSGMGGEDDLNSGGSPVSLASFDSFSFGSSSSSRSSVDGQSSPREIDVKKGLMEDIIDADFDLISKAIPSPPTTPKPRVSTKRISVKFLRLGLVTLSPEMLDLLAESLPGLERLEVAVKAFQASSDTHGRSSTETMYYKPPGTVPELQEVSETDGLLSPPVTPGAEFDLDEAESVAACPHHTQLNMFLGKLEGSRGPRRWNAMQKLSILSDSLPRQDISRHVEKGVEAWIGCPGVVRVNR